MLLRELLRHCEALSPLSLAETWDNVGLLVGDRDADIGHAMLTIDTTEAVLSEAQDRGATLLYSYHPPIFPAKKRILEDDLVYRAIKSGIAIFSPHTALDVAEGGTNDVLGDVVGLTDRKPLRISPPSTESFKLVTFVPDEEDALTRVSDAIFRAGAGQIGKYTSCSFRMRGEGTFFGEDGAKPQVGKAGRLETVEETRLEVVVPKHLIGAAISALRAFHPYEEPAFDLIPLTDISDRGMGRIGPVAKTSRRTLVERIKSQLGLAHLGVVGPMDGDASRVAVAAGSVGELFQEAIRQHADVLLTGELRHHDALRCAKAGLTAIVTGHSNSERIALRSVRSRLAERCSEVTFTLSTEDHDPIVIV